MELELLPVTDPGRTFVAQCEEHAADFSLRAAEHDRDATFPAENIEAMQKSGAFAACVPEEHGGLGLTSLHDLTVGVNRLARGDGSTAIASNMHLGATWVATRAWREATAYGDAAVAELTGGMLSGVGAGALVACVLITEYGTTPGYPLTELTRAEGGWLLNGRKGFGTLSPVADLYLVQARRRLDDDDQIVFASVLAGSDGVEMKDNWDALGMRASGSQDLVFRDCLVPDEAVFVSGQWGGNGTSHLIGMISGVTGLVGAFLGIAEEVRRIVVESVMTRRKAPSDRLLSERSAIQRAVAEMEIDLAASRAMLSRTTAHLDEYFASHDPEQVTINDLHRLNADVQCTKTFVNRKAVDVVDRALTASGGAGYLTASPLSRLYRDVRAGPFMQTYSPNEAYEYIGKVTLGLDPTLDL